MRKKIQKLKNYHRGFVILFAMVLSGILLAVGLGVGNVAYQEIKFSTSAKSSNDSFLAADTGVECALYHDRAGSSSFISSGTGVNCLGQFIPFGPSPITMGGTSSTWVFTIPPAQGQTYCSKVTVTKDNNPFYNRTDIVSKGYNVGDSECEYGNSNRVERELKVVYGTGIYNLALGKSASQSSTFVPPPNPASQAVDGNTNGNYAVGSLSVTNSDGYSWWEVDLGSSKNINIINIWNRTDCCSARLTDYWVFASNNPFGATDLPPALSVRANTWNSHQTTMPNPSVSIPLTNTTARYVRVQLTTPDYLQLAEVEVLGQ